MGGQSWLQDCSWIISRANLIHWCMGLWIDEIHRKQLCPSCVGMKYIEIWGPRSPNYKEVCPTQTPALQNDAPSTPHIPSRSLQNATRIYVFWLESRVYLRFRYAGGFLSPPPAGFLIISGQSLCWTLLCPKDHFVGNHQCPHVCGLFYSVRHASTCVNLFD